MTFHEPPQRVHFLSDWSKILRVLLIGLLQITLREKCPNTEFFLVRIQSEYRKIKTRKNSVFVHF